MTLILMVATCGVLTVLGVSCRRARLDLEEQLCECLHAPVAAAVGYGAGTVEMVTGPPVLTGIDGGRQVGATAANGGRRHLRVVEAG
jgi:hypothetical protein